jgi:hypothetical protein
MKWKLIFGIIASVLLAAMTPIITTFLVGGVYAKLILGKGGNYAESIIGWVAGLWIAPVVLIVGITYSVIVYRKSKPDCDERMAQPVDAANASNAASVNLDQSARIR